MHIDKIRELSLQYAKGTEGSTPTQPKHITCEWLAGNLHTLLAKRCKRLRLKRIGLKYAQYIMSPHWTSLRQSYIKQRGDACSVASCWNRGCILHHRTYASLGFESFAEVFLVCVHCHNKIHRLVRRWSGYKVSKRVPVVRSDYHPYEPLYKSKNKLQQPWGGLFARDFIPVKNRKSGAPECSIKAAD